ncbi:hypothetical protein JRO89_XS15G0163800 [Xanthoceras sorbifolium]|uniref:Cytochrome b561 and DOMON domain-containing protein n=1 Tax=Xanthoceras sorbifolium TaxID=99658 RepID=A0ABQ8H2K0_9ROSI|nr:hypothetical protein JRO89_XS15G0163800 [Xanthoceras sorbifolium]
MEIFTGPVITVFIWALFSLLSTTSQHSICSEAFTQMKEARNMTHCTKLPTLGAEFGWKYDDDQNDRGGHNNNRSNTTAAQNRIEILFGTRQLSEMGWLAWGVNPSSTPGMVGTRAIIGMRQPNGSWAVDTYNVTGGTKLGCGLLPSTIDVFVEKKEIEYNASNQYYAISATLLLPQPEYNISRLNHVWQVGYRTVGMEPMMHPTALQNVDSAETINLRTGESEGVHGVLNIMGWGIFLPLGAMIVRYFRVHPKQSRWWFRLHVGFQIVGYTIGTIGWIIGIWLGHASRYYTFPKHRTLSIFIFTFASLQMLALRLMPRSKDEYRKFWDLYHHSLGYALLAAIAIDIFLGIGILKPADRSWRFEDKSL